jgi:hypothetical protein
MGHWRLVQCPRKSAENAIALRRGVVESDLCYEQEQLPPRTGSDELPVDLHCVVHRIWVYG